MALYDFCPRNPAAQMICVLSFFARRVPLWPPTMPACFCWESAMLYIWHGLSVSTRHPLYHLYDFIPISLSFDPYFVFDGSFHLLCSNIIRSIHRDKHLFYSITFISCGTCWYFLNVPPLFSCAPLVFVLFVLFSPCSSPCLFLLSTWPVVRIRYRIAHLRGNMYINAEATVCFSRYLCGLSSWCALCSRCPLHVFRSVSDCICMLSQYLMY